MHLVDGISPITAPKHGALIPVKQFPQRRQFPAERALDVESVAVPINVDGGAGTVIAGADTVFAGEAGSVLVAHRFDVGVHVGDEGFEDLRRLALLNLKFDRWVRARNSHPVQHVVGGG